jgi:hypothetical protein
VLDRAERHNRLVDPVSVAARDRREEALEEVVIALERCFDRVELRESSWASARVADVPTAGSVCVSAARVSKNMVLRAPESVSKSTRVDPGSRSSGMPSTRVERVACAARSCANRIATGT